MAPLAACYLCSTSRGSYSRARTLLGMAKKHVSRLPGGSGSLTPGIGALLSLSVASSNGRQFCAFEYALVAKEFSSRDAYHDDEHMLDANEQIDAAIGGLLS